MKPTHWVLAATLLSLALLTSPVLAAKKHHVAGDSGIKKVISPVSTATSTPVANSIAVPTAPAPVPSGEVRFTAYLTGYGWPDNTPAGNAISDPVIHTGAGGTGTFSDPITLAVGHSIINSNDILDYPKGTKFYIPNLHKYFIVEDTCGDGNLPQNGPCHTGYPAGTTAWLDLWVGGVGANQSTVLSCEDAITDKHTVIKNPASNYAVNAGAIYGGSCATQYGETVVTQ